MDQKQIAVIRNPNEIKRESESEIMVLFPIKKQIKKIDVEIIYSKLDSLENSSRKKESGESELVLGIKLNKNIEPSNTILMNEVIHRLKDKGFYLLENCMFSYFSVQENMYVYCGKDPPDTEYYFIPISDIGPRLRIKCRRTIAIQQQQPNSIMFSSVSEPSSSTIKSQGSPNKEKGKEIRPKERKIGYVIEKVTEWRKYYTGIRDANGNNIKYSLDEAAQKVGIAKKTLDDYLLQLRSGKKYGFDFNLYKDYKIGVLRAFVKMKKAQNKESGELDKEKSGASQNDDFTGEFAGIKSEKDESAEKN